MADLSEFMKVPIGNYSEIMGVSRASFHSILGGHGNVPTGGPGPPGDSTSMGQTVMLTIDDTYIDADLTSFPILVQIENTSAGLGNTDLTPIFDTVDTTNATRLRFSDGTSNLYAEIELWDSVAKRGVLWVKVPLIKSSGGATIYMHYGDSTDNSTYTGYYDSTAAHNVWDDHFQGVWHFNQDPGDSGNHTDTVKDSTKNGYHFSFYSGVYAAELISEGAAVGYGIDFKGSSEYIGNLSFPQPATNQPFTIEWSLNPDTRTNNNQVVGANIGYTGFRCQTTSVGGIYCGIDQTTRFTPTGNLSSNVYVIGQEARITYVYDGTYGYFYKNGVKLAGPKAQGPVTGWGGLEFSSASASSQADGQADEYRFSLTDRSAEWIKATHYSIQDELITYTTDFGPTLGGTALIFGGYTGSRVNTIETITIGTLGNASDFGDLTGIVEKNSGCSNSYNQRGVSGGGSNPTIINIIEYVTINSSGDAANFGDLTEARDDLAACDNATYDRGVWGGGNTGADSNTMDYVTISTTSDASDRGDLTLARAYLASTSNGILQRGIFVGGNSTSGNLIESINISSTSNAVDFGDLTGGAASYRKDFGATSDRTNERAIFSGGANVAAVNIIEYLDISTAGDSVDFGDLIAVNQYNEATSNGTAERAIICGGSTSGAVNVIQYVTINTTGDSSDFGDLLSVKYRMGSCSNT